MVYLTLDDHNYLRGYTYGPDDAEIDLPKIESIDGLDLTDPDKMVSYHWDGEKLTLDESRLAELKKQVQQAEAERAKAESKRIALAEAQAALVSAQINTIAVDDTTALRWRLLYPDWSTGITYKTDEKVQCEDKLYRCLQGHTSQAGWEPGVATASLWTEICETHSGTIDDPIPYSGNMALVAGKYYSQDDVTYRCTRDTEIPVYHPLQELVGLYVEIANQNEVTM